MKKTSVQSNINLETLAGGAFAEKLNEALMQVAENIQNPNTEATTKRQIQITLKFAPNKTRQLVSTQIAVTTKLAATEAIDTQMIMGVNMRTGQIEIASMTARSAGKCLLMIYRLRNRKQTRREAIKWRNQRKRSKSPRQRRRPIVKRYRSTTWTTPPALSRKRSQTAGRFFARMTKLCR